MVNSGEVQRVQLAKSTLFTPCWCPWDLFRSFNLCSDAKGRVGCGKQREATATIQSLLKKTAALVPELAVEDLLSAELQPKFLSLQ